MAPISSHLSMSSFFTLPASQKKRKRDQDTATVSSKRRATPGKSRPPQKIKPTTKLRDESISGSDLEPDDQHGASDDDGASSGSESQDETAAERRLRLAERYLQNIKEQVQEEGFDAEQVDKELIASRLKEDVVMSFFVRSLYDGPNIKDYRPRQKVVCIASLQHDYDHRALDKLHSHILLSQSRP